MPGASAPANAGRNQLPLLKLPGLCCEALGSTRERALPIAAAWGLLYEAAHLLDDLEDGDDQDGAARASNVGQTLNVSIGLLTTANLALCLLDTVEIRHFAHKEFHQTILNMCAGQHADLVCQAPTLEQCWQIAEAKSGEFFALPCRTGARLAGADSDQIGLLSEYGRNLGILIQIRDDMCDLSPLEWRRYCPGGASRRSLPIAYALTVLPPAKRRALHQYLYRDPYRADWMKHKQDFNAPEAYDGEQARRQIIESGALLYLTMEVEKHRQWAEIALLKGARPGPARADLLDLLNAAATLSQA